MSSSNMRLMGRDGELFLCASIDRKTGVLYDSLRKIVSAPQPLQVFFKWGNFEPVTDDESADWIDSLPGEDELKIHEALTKKRGKKAADEPPPPNVRGKPLPKEEATEGWEVTEEDMAAAQRWVDRAMREAGFRD